MNSKLSYQAINRKSHKTLNTLFGIPVTITHNYSYTYSNIAFLDGGSMKSLIKISLFSKLCSTFSSNDIPVLRKTNIVLNTKDNQISLGDSNQCLKQHFRTSSQAFSRKENTTKQNSKFQSSQNSYHPQILPDSYSYPKTFQNILLNLKLFKTHSHSPTSVNPLSHSSQTIPHSHYSSQTFSHFQNSPHSPTSVNPLSHSSQTIPHSQTSPKFSFSFPTDFIFSHITKYNTS
ncbi:hypothetical protein Avbf_18053 [Armadillidium vulgare]|nr:hypothetical protein Avbf_18053 [Armadillidium vulgare]